MIESWQQRRDNLTIMARVGSFIDGEPVAADTQRELAVLCPATETRISTLLTADPAEVDRAVLAARAAFDKGSWPTLDVDERKEILLAIRDVITAHAIELATLESLDTGLPIAEVSQRQLPRISRNFEYFAELASTAAGESYTQTRNQLTVVTREPIGVCALLIPWNVPLVLGTLNIAACISFGNTCVVKPSEHTPLSTYRLVELMHQAGLPAGVVNLVNGPGPSTGDALVSHPGVDAVTFTGGTRTGKQVMASAAAGLKPVTLELGGKSASIVCADADPDAALAGTLAGIYSGNGQQCLAGSRILLQRPIAEEFMQRFVARARDITVGDPLDPETRMGPLCFQAHMERVLSYTEIAQAEGARILCGGQRPERLPHGFFVSPTAALAPDNSLRICQEEIFGPFATFLIFDTIDEAITIANDSRYGLMGYVWSRDLDTVMRISRRIRAGTVCINAPRSRELRAPFGGYKLSGVGRNGGHASMEFFTESKTVTLPTGGAR